MGYMKGRDNDYASNMFDKIDVFSLSEHLITQKLWRAVMGFNPSAFTGDDLPVEKVTWYDAVEFCNKLSNLMKLTRVYNIQEEQQINQHGSNETVITVNDNHHADGYRLPTEAEWEYAASGGNQNHSFMYAGSDRLDEVAWYLRNSDGKTHPVGQKKANTLGFYDMSGNVWEWCWDWFTQYSKEPGQKEVDPDRGKVIRGGSWDHGPFRCRVDHRFHKNPKLFINDLGFRIARNKLSG